MKISVISPVFNGEKTIELLIQRVTSSVEKLTSDFEIVLVDDGSQDNSWEIIERNTQKSQHIIGLKLSRNFGQHYAVTAGIEFSSGDVNFIIDCDLQDSPEYFKAMLDLHKEGNEVVFTKRKNRQHGLLKSSYSWLFNYIFRYLSNKQFDVDAGTLILFGSKARKAFLSIPDQDRLYLQFFKWIGFKTTALEVKHHKRHSGKSTYTLWKLIKLALQGVTSFSNKLLRLSIAIGFAFSALSFISIIVIIYLYFTQGFLAGWPSLISSLFFCTGVILINLGVIGLYLGKTFTQSKNRPLYIIDKVVNGK